MPLIIPAILEETWEAFEKKLSEIQKIPDVQAIQVDFSDAKFTPHQTLPISDLDLLNPAYKWQAHLMVEDPRAYFFDAKLVGFTSVIFHFEAIADKAQLPKIVEEIQELKMTPILGIDRETSAEDITAYLDLFSEVLVLSVKPGYQSQQIIADTFDKIQKLRNIKKNVIIEVDGGVRKDNIRELLKAGADNFVIGSALFEKHGDHPLSAAQNFEQFVQEIKKP